MARVSKYERTTTNDIKYRGPLSYRHLLILGWICISFKVLDILIKLAVQLDPNQPQWMLSLGKVCSIAGTFALPMFLIANFAIILDKKKTYKQQLIKFGGLSLAIVVLFVILKEHYIQGIVAAFVGNRSEAATMIEDTIYTNAMTGNLIFNLFIDLFLCTLFMFFLEYEPVKYFQGNKLTLFRAFAIFPVLYEVGALALRVVLVFTDLKPPYIIYPFLTTKPFMSFILFIFLAMHIKLEKSRFKKKGKTEEEFEEYADTNVHSLRFSIFTSIMMLITGLIDIAIYVLGTVFLAAAAAGVDLAAEEITTEAQTAMDKILPLAEQAVYAWRFGEHFPMIFLIPIILLFSYTRNHENDTVDLIIPVGGVALAVLVAIEGTYQGIVMNVPILMKQLQDMISQFIK